MEQLKGGILITPRDIQRITGKSYNTARLQHQFVRQALNKFRANLTVQEYCKYMELDIEEIIEFLNKIRLQRQSS